jgi:hypothetical protein
LRILLTGCRGQVGSELARVLPELGEVIATDRSSLDLAAAGSIREVVEHTRPQVIVNAAVYRRRPCGSEEALALRQRGRLACWLKAKRSAASVHYRPTRLRSANRLAERPNQPAQCVRALERGRRTPRRMPSPRVPDKLGVQSAQPPLLRRSERAGSCNSRGR